VDLTNKNIFTGVPIKNNHVKIVIFDALMKRAVISILAAVYVLLMLSATIERVCFERDKSSSPIELSDCEDVPLDNEEATSEDYRDYEDDENFQVDLSLSLQKIKPHLSKVHSSYFHSPGFHFPEIDSPPPQA
jgi:hypothetical protein